MFSVVWVVDSRLATGGALPNILFIHFVFFSAFIFQSCLAYEHFRAREATFYTGPLVTITLAMGVLSFFAGTSLFGDAYIQRLTISAGILSLVSVTWQKMGKTWNYGARSDMHRKAFTSIEKLRTKVNFELRTRYVEDIERDQTEESGTSPTVVRDKLKKLVSSSSSKNEPGKKEDETGKDAGAGQEGKKKDSDLLQGYQQIFEQILESCSSALPVSVSQAYLLIQTRLEFGLKSGNTRLDVEKVFIEDYDDTLECISLSAFTELSNVFIKGNRYPLFLVEPSQAVEKALSAVAMQFDDRNQFFASRLHVDADEEKKLIKKHFSSTPYFNDMKILLTKKSIEEKKRELEVLRNEIENPEWDNC